jgi:8-oxo-dGTP pyrophosphatase MutT (NUDIX family)
LTDLRFSTVSTVDMRYEPRPWPWAEANSARIDDHWSGLLARNPALFDGPVLLLHSGGLEDGVFHGAFILGVMGGHTANAGRIYFPAGTPDPDDLVGETVDLAGSVLRELREETGLGPEDVAVADGWTLIEAPARVACLKEVSVDGSADAIRSRILETLSHETQPELSDIRIVRSVKDIDDAAMPPFVSAYLRQKLG